MYATSQRDGSSDDKIASVGKQAAQVLQSHFDCGGDDPRPTGGIPMETRSRRRCFVEKASASSESRIVSSGTTSQHWPVKGKAASGGEVRDDDILTDIDEVFTGPKVLLEFGAQRRNLSRGFHHTRPGRRSYSDYR